MKKLKIILIVLVWIFRFSPEGYSQNQVVEVRSILTNQLIGTEVNVDTTGSYITVDFDLPSLNACSDLQMEIKLLNPVTLNPYWEFDGQGFSMRSPGLVSDLEANGGTFFGKKVNIWKDATQSVDAGNQFDVTILIVDGSYTIELNILYSIQSCLELNPLNVVPPSDNTVCIGQTALIHPVYILDIMELDPLKTGDIYTWSTSTTGITFRRAGSGDPDSSSLTYAPGIVEVIYTGDVPQYNGYYSIPAEIIVSRSGSVDTATFNLEYIIEACLALFQDSLSAPPNIQVCHGEKNLAHPPYSLTVSNPFPTSNIYSWSSPNPKISFMAGEESGKDLDGPYPTVSIIYTGDVPPIGEYTIPAIIQVESAGASVVDTFDLIFDSWFCLSFHPSGRATPSYNKVCAGQQNIAYPPYRLTVTDLSQESHTYTWSSTNNKVKFSTGQGVGNPIDGPATVSLIYEDDVPGITGNQLIVVGVKASRPGESVSTSFQLTYNVSNCDLSEFVLVNAETDQDIGPLADGDTINSNALPAGLNVRANMPAGIGQKSVFFDFNSGFAFRRENVFPYYFAGDGNGNAYPFYFGQGTFDINAIAYSGTNGTGAMLHNQSVEFTLTSPDYSRYVESFSVVNTNTGKIVPGLSNITSNSLTLDLSTIGTNKLAFIANVNKVNNSRSTGGSVVFNRYHFPTGHNIWTENVFPYSSFGDYPFKTNAGVFTPGNKFSLTATPFSKRHQKGIPGKSKTLFVSVINSGSNRTADIPEAFNVYPNPTDDKLVLSLPDWGFIETSTLIVSDLFGRVVLRRQVSASDILDNKYGISLGHLPQGVFVITWKQAGRQLSRKVLKTR